MARSLSGEKFISKTTGRKKTRQGNGKHSLPKIGRKKVQRPRQAITTSGRLAAALFVNVLLKLIMTSSIPNGFSSEELKSMLDNAIPEEIAHAAELGHPDDCDCHQCEPGEGDIGPNNSP